MSLAARRVDKGIWVWVRGSSGLGTGLQEGLGGIVRGIGGYQATRGIGSSGFILDDEAMLLTRVDG